MQFCIYQRLDEIAMTPVKEHDVLVINTKLSCIADSRAHSDTPAGHRFQQEVWGSLSRRGADHIRCRVVPLSLLDARINNPLIDVVNRAEVADEPEIFQLLLRRQKNILIALTLLDRRRSAPDDSMLSLMDRSSDIEVTLINAIRDVARLFWPAEEVEHAATKSAA